ncbi:MAG: hypothetical protein J6K21_03770 [Bacilli bacterium]|nr:hypothetical protein [Bacilli bacterium]
MKKKKKKISYLNLILIFTSVCLTISVFFNIYLSNKKYVNYEMDENIVFFGDSITNKYKVEEFFPNSHVVNSGISGDKSSDLIERMDDVYKYNPSKVFLLIGINDLNNAVDQDEILNNIQKIVNGIKTNRKYTKIYIESVYPINRNSFNEKDYSFNEDITNDTIKDFNNKLKNLCKENKINYVNVYDNLLDSDGNLKDIYTVEGLHLNDLGYYKVTSSIIKYIKK